LEDNEDKSSLVRKVVVADKKRERKVKHLVKSAVSNEPGAFAKSGGCGCGCETMASSRAAPGADLVDKKCDHGGVKVMIRVRVYSDTQERKAKRGVLNKFMMEDFYLYRMCHVS